MRQTEVIRYSISFKQQVIRELESGRFGNISEAKEHYGINGATTIRNWLGRYGRNHLCPKIVRVQMPDEKDQIKQLKKQIRQLQQVLGRTQAEKVINEAFLEIACEKLGEDVGEFKKSRFTAVGQARRAESAIAVALLCETVGMSRQNYYKVRRFRNRRQVDERLVLGLVKKERFLQPRLGTRKLLCILSDEFSSASVRIGRDRIIVMKMHLRSG